MCLEDSDLAMVDKHHLQQAIEAHKSHKGDAKTNLLDFLL